MAMLNIVKKFYLKNSQFKLNKNIGNNIGEFYVIVEDIQEVMHTNIIFDDTINTINQQMA
ncbi:hypothetical protein BpHYR1_023887 [Brachionus plicatilis]|uniref:Uncharacterized protein n=1 Tax=Brachionus plicatilis TaxID=10195 RepID=A0A3M7PEE8_BRAPC|nr:hypothetical protein BpHYR1_023887 [Brachionus plicatilis]